MTDTTEQSVDQILAAAETETPETNEEVTTPNVVQEEKPEKTKEFQSMEAQKLHYKEKAERLEKQLSEKTVGGTNPMEVVKLAKALEGYNEAEVDFITRNAGGAKIDDVIKATKDEWVKDAIAARRKKEADSKKVPGSSSPDFSSPSKNYQDIAKMTKAEFKDYEEKQTRKGSTGI
ncbi:hypothetical protein M0R04_13065 [Candidatus Dojkabacteria bacterium]|jgi:hypothetical protein|nr:hypothetical protein [Candidatus Dojkabacteria bacterium]